MTKWREVTLNFSKIVFLFTYQRREWSGIYSVFATEKVGNFFLDCSVIERREIGGILHEVPVATHLIDTQQRCVCVRYVPFPWLHSTVKVDRHKFRAKLFALSGRNPFIIVKLSGDRMLLRHIASKVIGTSALWLALTKAATGFYCVTVVVKLYFLQISKAKEIRKKACLFAYKLQFFTTSSRIDSGYRINCELIICNTANDKTNTSEIFEERDEIKSKTHYAI